MASSDSQIHKPQRRRPRRAELPDVNINTVAQSINAENWNWKSKALKVENLKMFNLIKKNAKIFHIPG